MKDTKTQAALLTLQKTEANKKAREQQAVRRLQIITGFCILGITVIFTILEIIK